VGPEADSPWCLPVLTLVGSTHAQERKVSNVIGRKRYWRRGEVMNFHNRPKVTFDKEELGEFEGFAALIFAIIRLKASMASRIRIR
jgi:hypothetical protein